MALSVKNTKDLDLPWSHWFLYGDSGAGKTQAAATFPRPCIISPENEGGITTLRGRDIPYYTVTGMKAPLSASTGRGGMIAIIDELEREYTRDPNGFPFDTLVFDGLTHYTDLAVEDITSGGMLPMDQQRWGTLWSHLRNIQARVRRMDVHCVLISLAKTDIADDKTVFGAPLIQGQASLKLPAACDVIAFAEPGTGKDPKYRVHTRRYKHYIARSRFARLPEVIENFNFEAVKNFLGADAPQT